jgi:hypothetical protein
MEMEVDNELNFLDMSIYRTQWDSQKTHHYRHNDPQQIMPPKGAQVVWH